MSVAAKRASIEHFGPKPKFCKMSGLLCNSAKTERVHNLRIRECLRIKRVHFFPGALCIIMLSFISLSVVITRKATINLPLSLTVKLINGIRR